jgi:hypothetical protein
MATPPDFTAGQVLTAAQMNAVGLWLIKTQTIGSAVSSVTVTDAFSADYDNYLITITGGSSSGSGNLRLQLGATNSGYKYQLIYASYANTPLAIGSSSSSSWLYLGNQTTTTLQAHCVVSAPFLAEHSRYSAEWSSNSDAGNATGILENTTSYTSFVVLSQPATTISGGTIRVYGYNN